jgi:hypothetical protein
MAANLRPGHVKDIHHRQGAKEKLARFRSMNEVIPFMSRCPQCGDRRLQEGYTHRMLRRFLNTGTSIEAYCDECHALWPISGLERDGIVIGLCD